MGPFEFDPVIFSIPVPFSDLALPIRWYAVAYVAGLLFAWRYCLRLATLPPHQVSTGQIDDFLVWAMLGVILGGRLGFVVFYRPEFFIDHPIEIPMMWKGGMSFHGGLLGVAAAMFLFARRHRIALLNLTDIISAAAPIGQLFGRIANFINGELWGRATDVPWGVIPAPGLEPRHPSQLYHAGLEGLALVLLLAFLVFGPAKALRRPGLVTGTWIAGYAVVRILLELFRQPDDYIGDGGFLIFGTTWGQWLSLPLLLGGGFLIWRALKHPPMVEG